VARVAGGDELPRAFDQVKTARAHFCDEGRAPDLALDVADRAALHAAAPGRRRVEDPAQPGRVAPLRERAVVQHTRQSGAGW
jgi:hypothetical protein